MGRLINIIAGFLRKIASSHDCPNGNSDCTARAPCEDCYADRQW